ncbi:phosphatase PAP2 family protein [Pseudoxanthomonas sp. 10H]|uniref:phosphatase PAP2 family protein n=1 Tax=Pseudoxanthomonas sp. 10H TaxID=3242729 RepID=UPI0035581188
MPLSPPDRSHPTFAPEGDRRGARLRAHDRGWCIRANRWGARGAVRRYFSVVSRLGDGVFWYALMATLVAFDGRDGLAASLHLALTGVAALALYRRLKRWTRRPRPFAADGRIRAWVAPLDEFSFPSGHTLHAVAFTVVALAYYPWLAAVLIPFTASVAVSRVVLGLHYPSDVLAATAIGSLLAGASLWAGTML